MSNEEPNGEQQEQKVYSDREEVLQLLSSDPGSLNHLSPELKNDKDLMKKIQAYGDPALKYASDELRQDKKFLLELFEIHGGGIEYVADNLRWDRDLILLAAKKSDQTFNLKGIDPKDLSNAEREALKQDQEVMLAVCLSHPRGLEVASPELQDDKKFVIQAVTNHGSNIQFASDRLRADVDVALAAYGGDKAGMGGAIIFDLIDPTIVDLVRAEVEKVGK